MNIFFQNLESVAPSLVKLLSRHHARLNFSVTAHDAISTYGHSLTYHVFAEVLTETCKTCHETQWSKPSFDCSYHRFVVDWRCIANSEGQSEQDALTNIDRRVAIWLEKINSPAIA